MDTKERESSREDAEIAEAEAVQAEADDYARRMGEEQEQRWRDSQICRGGY